MFRSVLWTVGNMVRDAGLSLDRAGMALQGRVAYREALCRHRRIQPLLGKSPSVSPDAFVAPSASVIGDVEVGQKSSVWYGAALRGDTSKIKIGTGTSIGDRTVINVPDFRLKAKQEFLDTVIGNRVTIGHGVVLSGCTINDESVVDMGAVVNEGAVVGQNSVVAAGSVVAPREQIPSGQLWSGTPAKFERELTADEVAALAKSADNHFILSRKHMEVLQKFEDELQAYRNLADANYDPNEARSPVFDSKDPKARHPPIGEVPNRV